MKAKIVLHAEEHRNRAIEIIRALPLDVVHEVEIREHKKDRSKDQNALYWKWLTIIGNELGESKEEVHERYKEKFLIHIYERDNPDFAEMIETLKAVYRQGMKQQAISLHKKIVELTSTTTATVKQMSEYMTEIERHAATLAISLPHPED